MRLQVREKGDFESYDGVRVRVFEVAELVELRPFEMTKTGTVWVSKDGKVVCISCPSLTMPVSESCRHARKVKNFLKVKS